MANFFPAVTSIKLPNYFAVTADMTSGTWNTQTTHEIATVTGCVHVVILVQCTGTLTDAADAAVISLGVEGSTQLFIANTNAAGAGAHTITNGEIWYDTTSNAQTGNLLTGTTGGNYLVIDKVVNNGIDIGYEITGAALTGGSLKFNVWWEDLVSGSVAAGAGGAL